MNEEPIMKEARKIGLITGTMATVICGALAFKINDPELAGLVLIVLSPLIGMAVAVKVHDTIIAAVKEAQEKHDHAAAQERNFKMIKIGECKVDELKIPVVKKNKGVSHGK